MNWETDIEKAKSMGWVLVALDDEQNWIGFSCWIEKDQRWNMLKEDEQPYAFLDGLDHPLNVLPVTHTPGGMLTVKTPLVKLPAGVTPMLPPGVST